MEELTRTRLDASTWNKVVGKVYFNRCPDDQRYFRTIRIHLNPFTNALSPQISNPVMGEPPEGSEEINPLILNRLLKVQMHSSF